MRYRITHVIDRIEDVVCVTSWAIRSSLRRLRSHVINRTSGDGPETRGRRT
jgi:hypothetical protein